MSKEYLEAFETVYNNLDYLTSDIVIEDDEVNGCLMTIKEQLLTIKQALHRLEAIDNSNPSEALEILDDFKYGLVNKEIGMVMFQQYWFFTQIEKVKQALLKAQEQEKENAEYKHLEEQLGCPLEVVEKLFRQEFIYFKYLSNVQTMKVKVIKGLSYGSNPSWYFTCIYDNVDFIYISLKDYKKTWWLREDKSE